MTIVVRPSSTPVITRRVVRPVVTSDDSREVVVNESERRVIVESPTRPVHVRVGGVQGPQGEPGGSVPQISFSYGDAAGAIWTPDAAGVLTEVSIDFVVPFNGLSPSVILGTLSDPDCIMSALHSAPTVEAEFENTANVRLAAGEAVHIAITPSGSTAGNGHIYLTFIPD